MERKTRSLAEIAPDQTVRVRRILFDCLRERCGDLGLHEGDRLRDGGWDGSVLLARRDDGGSVRCPVELARFVEIEASTS